MRYISNHELEELITDYVNTNVMPQYQPSPYEVIVELKFTDYAFEWVGIVVARPLSQVFVEGHLKHDRQVISYKQDIKSLLEGHTYDLNTRVRIFVIPPTPLEKLRLLSEHNYGN